MKTDLISKPQTAYADGNEYKFQFDYTALSTLEDETGKGVYQFYSSLVSDGGITLSESIKLLICAMLKHHTEEETQDLIAKIKAHPGLWLKIKEPVVASFILPLMPPEILERTVIKSKKKTKNSKN